MGVLTREMEKQRVIGLGALDEPVHGTQDVVSGGLTDRVLLVVGQDNHILPLVAVSFSQEGRDVLNIVQAAAQLAVLTEVVDANEQRLSLAGTSRVLEAIAFRGTVAELLEARGWRWRRTPVSVCP